VRAIDRLVVCGAEGGANGRRLLVGSGVRALQPVRPEPADDGDQMALSPGGGAGGTRMSLRAGGRLPAWLDQKG
jgi:hypothetical protein